MIQTQSLNNLTEAHVQTYTFKREVGKWYIDLPEYIEQGLDKEDLAMVEGSYKLLSTISNGRNKMALRLSTQTFSGAEVLELQDHCNAIKGGAIYLLERCNGRQVNSLLWICDIALFVFGDMPQQIYFQKVNNIS